MAGKSVGQFSWYRVAEEDGNGKNGEEKKEEANDFVVLYNRLYYYTF